MLDVLSVGDEEAATLGVNVRRVAARDRRLRDDRHRGGGRRQRADRLRRDHRPALRSGSRSARATGSSCRSRCSSAAAFLVLCDVLARTVISPGRAADRRRHRVLRRAVLRHRAAHEQELHVTAARARRASRSSSAGRACSTASTPRSRAGEWVALIGPNGAGKSTLLRAVAGLVPYPRLGRARRRRGLAAADGATLARRLAFVPQAPLLPPEMRVREYVLLGRTPHIGPFGAESARDLEAARARARAARPRRARRAGRCATLTRRRAAAGGARARARAGGAASRSSTSRRAALDIGRQQQVLELVAALREQGELTVVSARCTT